MIDSRPQSLHIEPPLCLCPAEDYPALEKLLGGWLRPAGPRLGLEYPQLFRFSSDLDHLVARGTQGDILAHAALLIRRIVTDGAVLPVALISCVATCPEARGRGLGTRIVARALERARDQGAALALLWSDREAFYGRLGFRRSGRELVFWLTAAGFPGSWPEPVLAGPEHVSGLLRLHARSPVRMQRSRQELARLLEIPRLETYVWPAHPNPAAYLCLGKGLDFPGVVHEIGGEPCASEALLGGVLAARSERTLALLLPPWETELTQALQARGFSAAEGALGLAAILDWRALERFTAALGPLARLFRSALPFLPFHLGGLDSI